MANVRYHVSLRSLTHVFQDSRRALTALADVALDVAWGQFLTVIGPSGCGKSTLLRIIGGLLRPSEGEVLIDGAAPVESQRRRDIGFVFQDPALLPWRTVLSNVRLPLEIDHGAGDRTAPSPEELLELTGLADFHSYYPHELSGGMQQRVAIARALAFDPSLLLMDEPFGALDEITRSAMRYELLRIWSAGGGAPSGAEGRPTRRPHKTVVFVTHSIPEAIALSDRVVVLSPRPGAVRAAIDIELPRPRTQEMERTAPFLDYADQLRNLLKEAPA
ncbi:MAG: ABC transporter ATP-binding protein [Chloroflexi bacterium]|nr:ABC transporter ATP-binding protein [Chloroflexota bacterium]